MTAKNVNCRFTIACFFGLISIFLKVNSVQAEELQNLERPEISRLYVHEINADSPLHDTCKIDKILPTLPVDSVQPSCTTINDRPDNYDRFSPDTLVQHNHYNDEHNFETPDDWPEPINDRHIYSLFLLEKLEYSVQDDEDLFNWELVSWVGGDYERLWIKSEGDVGLEDGDGEAEVQLLYGKLVSPFWDFQAGLRYDQSFGSEENRGRAFGVVGIQGLAPYLFEIDAALFVSEDGDVSARFVTEYQLLLTQRLILQPELETNLAVQKAEEFGVGPGINDIDLGVRLRYEFSRQFAPYVGVNWSRKFGETADLAREEGESVDDLSVVGGMRLMF